jgi:transcriptional regulator with GAF, ATPase, and Fis domain
MEAKKERCSVESEGGLGAKRGADKSRCRIRNGFVVLQPGYAAGQQRFNREYHDDTVQSTIADLVRALVRGAGIEEMLTKLTSASPVLVPGAEFAKISLIDNGHLHSIAGTSELTALLDDVQQASGRGPCLDAINAQKPIRSSDLRTDVRWPRFARSATAAGVHSVLSFPLDMPGASGATLSLFGSRPGAFGLGSDAVAAMLANHAAIALVTEEHERQFRAALATRDVIGQAKGMLMERFDIDSGRAFAMLKKISQQTNTPVRQLAVRLVDHARAHNDDAQSTSMSDTA